MWNSETKCPNAKKWVSEQGVPQGGVISHIQYLHVDDPWTSTTNASHHLRWRHYSSHESVPCATELNIMVNGCNIPTTNTQKMFGMYFDSMITFAEHGRQITHKVQKITNVLKLLSRHPRFSPQRGLSDEITNFGANLVLEEKQPGKRRQRYLPRAKRAVLAQLRSGHYNFLNDTSPVVLINLRS